MNILFLADVPFDDPCSGSEMVLMQQSTGLSRTSDKVFAITRDNDRKFNIETKEIKGVETLCYSANPKSFFSFIFQLFKIPHKLYNQIDENTKFSIILCHQPFTLLPLLVKGLLGNIPIIYVFHSPNHEEYLISREIGNNLDAVAHVRKWIETYCLRQSKKIMVLSEYMKDKVINICTV